MRWSLSLALFVVACGGTTPPTTTPPQPVGSATPKETAKVDPPKVDPKPEEPKPEEPKPKGPFHWTKFPGPIVKTTISTKQAWAVIPVGLEGDWGIAKLALLDYVRAEGDEHVLIRMGKEEIFVPRAMVREATPAKGVKKGSTVVVNVAAASAHARVTEITKGDDGEWVKFQYLWAGSVSDGELALHEMVLVEDKLAFGNMVEYEDKGGHAGMVVFTEKNMTWVIDETGRPLRLGTNFMKPMKITKALKKGDRVRAPLGYQFAEGTVTEVLDGGLRYKVKDQNGKEEKLAFHLVSGI